jgi:hypothetical protein
MSHPPCIAITSHNAINSASDASPFVCATARELTEMLLLSERDLRIFCNGKGEVLHDRFLYASAESRDDGENAHCTATLPTGYTENCLPSQPW